MLKKPMSLISPPLTSPQILRANKTEIAVSHFLLTLFASPLAIMSTLQDQIHGHIITE